MYVVEEGFARVIRGMILQALNGVVGRGDGQICAADLTAGQTQRLERLGRRHFVDKVQIDVEQGRLAGLLADNVVLPDLLKQCAWGWCLASFPISAHALTPSDTGARQPLPVPTMTAVPSSRPQIWECPSAALTIERARAGNGRTKRVLSSDATVTRGSSATAVSWPCHHDP